METIAVYWEERVRVYGITEMPGLVLGTLQLDAEHLPSWSDRLAALEDNLRRFELIVGLAALPGQLELYMLVDRAAQDVLQDRLTAWIDGDRSARFTMRGRVDMVFLHGPHFQDRFGIAETAFTALAKKGIDILLSGCAGTSMYMIFTEGQGGSARQVLTETFIIPTAA